MAPRIYSKGGAIGVTSLLSGQRVSKCSPLVDAYGVIDELQAQIGLLVSVCMDSRMVEILRRVQVDLLSASAELSMSQGGNLNKLKRRITQDDVSDLEKAIDRYADIFPLPRHFILPGGSVDSAQAHVARTVCRRAERRVCSLGGDPAYAMVSQYLNRLSDLLFTLAWGMELMALAKEALGINPEVKGETYEYAPLHS